MLPVLTLDAVEVAVPLVAALAAGGLRVVEVTLRTEAGYAAIERLAEEVPEVVVGAGTITRAEQLRAAESAGARFAVSPGVTDDLLRAARRRRLPFVPGVATVSEAMAARRAGFDVLKLFPAAAVGGVAFLRAIRGPLPELAFCPTGGIDARSFRAYLAEPNVLCVGGSWIVPRAALAARRWDAITIAAREVAR